MESNTKLSWFGLGLLVLGVIVAAEALPLPLPRPLPLGTILMGAGLALGFVDSLTSGRLSFHTEGFAPERYQGLAARLWGLLMLLAGSALATGGLAEWVSPGFLERMFRSPLGLGGSLVLGGILVALYGLTQVLGPSGTGEGWLRRLSALPARLVFGLVVLLGLSIVLAGGLYIIAPNTVSGWVSAARNTLPAPPLP